MKAKHDAVEILRELIGVGVFPKVAFHHSLEKGNGDDPEPLPLQLDQAISHRSRAIIHFAGGCGEDASTGQLGGSTPLQPALEEDPKARLSARSLEGRADDRLDEDLCCVLEHLDLERFFRTEVREEPTLGELEVIGQGPDRQALQPGLTGKADGVVEDVFAGLSAFGHGIE